MVIIIAISVVVIICFLPLIIWAIVGTDKYYKKYGGANGYDSVIDFRFGRRSKKI